MADRAALEMPCALAGTVGSNPTLSVGESLPSQVLYLQFLARGGLIGTADCAKTVPISLRAARANGAGKFPIARSTALSVASVMIVRTPSRAIPAPVPSERLLCPDGRRADYVVGATAICVVSSFCSSAAADGGRSSGPKASAASSLPSASSRRISRCDCESAR